jgi:hypothetical protein
LVNWFIWLARNTKIFDNKSSTTNLVTCKTLGLFQNWIDIHPTIAKKKTLISPSIAEDTPTGWFDGTTHRNEILCGAGGLIRTSKNSFFQMDFLLWPGHQHKGRAFGGLGNSSLGQNSKH